MSKLVKRFTKLRVDHSVRYFKNNVKKKSNHNVLIEVNPITWTK